MKSDAPVWFGSAAHWPQHAEDGNYTICGKCRAPWPDMFEPCPAADCGFTPLAPKVIETALGEALTVLGRFRDDFTSSEEGIYVRARAVWDQVHDLVEKGSVDDEALG